MSGLISRMFGSSSANTAPTYAAPTYAASATPDASQASVPATGSTPIASMGQDAYGNPVAAYQVPTHVPSIIPGGIVAWQSYEKLAPDLRQSTYRVPVQENGPVRASRARGAAYENYPSEPAYANQPLNEPGYAEGRAYADGRPYVGSAAPRLRDAQGHFLPKNAMPDAYGQYPTTNEPGLPRGSRVPRANARYATGYEGELAPVRGAANGYPETARQAASRTRMETRMRTLATPKISTQVVGDMVKTSALWGGAISLGLNTYAMLKGQETFGQGGSNVVGDVAASAVGGVGGALASSLGTAAAASMFGASLAGFPLTLLGVGLGFGGFWVADHLFRKTTLFQSIQHDVKGLLGG